MSKTILEVGKELMSKSLNSYRRKTGITQLEENNKMQDGILNGILSQVDDAYVEKTEQSNVIHLEGSGDGVVVLDSIEGNTMVNLIDVDNTHGTYIMENTKNTGIIYGKTTILKPNTTYTIMYYIKGTTEVNVTSVASMFRLDSYNQDGSVINGYFHGFTGKLTTNYQFVKSKFETPNNIGFINLHVRNAYHDYALESNTLTVKDVIILEGDWTNKETPSHFIGLQSSFEEKVNDEGKYEIEILMNNLNLLDSKKLVQGVNDYGTIGKVPTYTPQQTLRCTTKVEDAIPVKPNTVVSCYSEKYNLAIGELKNGLTNGDSNWRAGRYTTTTKSDTTHIVIQVCKKDNTDISPSEIKEGDIVVYLGDSSYSNIPHKQNKLKLLINEPLRGTNVSKDMLCIKDGKLVVERRYKQLVLNGNNTEKWSLWRDDSKTYRWNSITDIASSRHVGDMMCDKIPRGEFHEWWNLNLTLGIDYGDPNGRTDVSSIFICNPNLDENVTSLRQWLSENNLQVVLPLKEPYYEEVLNEYGEPVLLEGYENGTLYIDSTIVPTTTVRYTPKMESFSALKEISNYNNILSEDINDTIIPYMMDVDLMIMEKEMSIPSLVNNTRTMEVVDMTSMQKRTQEMLERLIKGRTLTEQECRTRVTTYLSAGKVTDDQAEELMLLISEVYA